MNNDICFMALGGAQNVGASCYYLKLGDTNILLDCGTGANDKVIYSPDFFSLLQTKYMHSLRELNAVFISHAHADHIGSLPRLAKDLGDTPIYMTEQSALLTEYQLYDRQFLNRTDTGKDEYNRLAIKTIIERFVKVPYYKELKLGKCKVKFYPAGHIPGAMMTMFNYRGKNILYTGDFSVKATPLTPAQALPDNIKIDTLIMCGLHAKHPSYIRSNNALNILLDKIKSNIARGKNVYCRVTQLSKGIELLKALNDDDFFAKSDISIYPEDNVMQIAKKMERVGVSVLNTRNHPINDLAASKQPHIILGGKSYYDAPHGYKWLLGDFSLHDSFDDMTDFVKHINPRRAVIVHCAAMTSDFDYSIEQPLLLDADCTTQFIFPEVGELHYL